MLGDGKNNNDNFIVFGLIRLGLEPMNSRNRRACYPLITPQMRFAYVEIRES